MAEQSPRPVPDRRALGALVTNPDLDQWVRFVEGERVAIGTGKVELGQGIRTALAAIAADELGVDPSRIDVRSASTGVTPNEWVTAGSGSIEQSGMAVRQACAHARRILLARAADHLGAPAADLVVDDGRITAPGGPSVSYWALAARPFAYRVEQAIETIPPGERRWTGRGLPRTDLPAKVRGDAVFVQDFWPEGVRHARVVRPPGPGYRLASLDLRGDLAIEAAEVVRRGSFVAVVADRVADAVRAADRLRAACTWSLVETTDRGGSTPDELVASASAATPIVGGTAVEGELPPIDHDHAHTVLRRRYTKPFILHGSIGPSAAVARFDGRRLQVWSHSQGIEILRLAMAPVVGLDPDAITVTHVDGPGCYGHNGADDAACDAALIAMAKPGRPVSLSWSRDDEHGWEPAGPAMVVDLAAGVDRAGHIVSWEHDIYSPPHTGRPRPHDGPVSGLLASWHVDPPFDAPEPRPGGGFHSGAHRNADPLYAIDERRIVSHLVPQPVIRTSSTRSLGAYANVFALESFVDELAAAAGIDPIEFRLAHLAHDGRARAVIEAAVDLAGGLAAAGGVDAPGRGIGFARYENAKAYCAVVAEVHVVPRTGLVRLTRAWIAADAGEVIDPDGLANQLEGGVVQAASWTLKEEVGLGRTGVTTRDWESYPILRFSEAPRLETRVLAGPGRPLGAGEASTGPAAAAIANAFANATGVRVRDLPLRPDRVRAALAAAL